MRVYQALVRCLVALIFIGGGVSHLILGRTNPGGYAVFGDTALLPALGDLWSSFVMPNVAWLTILLGVYEIAAGALLLTSGAKVRAGAALILAFLLFITVVGYGFPATGVAEDIVKNRIITIVMAVAILPVLLDPSSAGPRDLWRRSPHRQG